MDQEGDFAPAGFAWVAAMLAVTAVAVALAVLPALVAAGAAAGDGQVLAGGFASLAAVVGGVKLVAVAWGLASRMAADTGGQRAAAVVD